MVNYNFMHLIKNLIILLFYGSIKLDKNEVNKNTYNNIKYFFGICKKIQVAFWIPIYFFLNFSYYIVFDVVVILLLLVASKL